jgi:hypothetical protein
MVGKNYRENTTMETTKTAKQRHRIILVEYLGDPGNPWPRRQEFSTKILGFRQANQIYKTFTLEEINQIELEALNIRRQKYSRLLSMVDTGLLKKAAEGDPAAAKLVYQRFENWSEKSEHKLSNQEGEPCEITINFVSADGNVI